MPFGSLLDELRTVLEFRSKLSVQVGVVDVDDERQQKQRPLHVAQVSDVATGRGEGDQKLQRKAEQLALYAFLVWHGVFVGELEFLRVLDLRPRLVLVDADIRSVFALEFA